VFVPRQLRALIDVGGGFTLDPRSGRAVRRGVSVCLDPDLSIAFARSAWHDDRISDWLAVRAGSFSRERRFLGGWLDRRNDRVWLDVVHVLPGLARPLAVALARRRGQHCVYDLGREQLLVTGEVS
jgi:hypothetical protein